MTDQHPHVTDDPSTPTALPSTRRGGMRTAAQLARALALPTIVAAGLLLVLMREGGPALPWFFLVTTACLVLCVALAALSLRARHSDRARRAVRPVEAGILVGIVVWLGVAILGGVAALDAFAAGSLAACGVTLVASVLHPLIEGRRRSRAAFGALLVLAVAVVGWGSALFTGAFDHYEDQWFEIEAHEPQRQLVQRVGERGVLLGEPLVVSGASPLDSGYVASAHDPSIITAVPGIPGDPAAPAVDSAGPIPPSGHTIPQALADVAAVAAAPASTPSLVGWASLRARSDQRLELEIDREIAGGLDGPVAIRMQRGSCSGPGKRTPVDSWSWTRRATGTDRRIIQLRVPDLRVDSQLSVVVGTLQPLGPTRCADLLSARGIALASFGAASFHDECIAPLELAPAELDLLLPSSFADRECAETLTRLAGIVAGAVVPAAHVPDVRSCLATANWGNARPPIEHPVPGGVAFERKGVPSFDDPLLGCAGHWHQGIAWPVGAYPSAEAAPAGAEPASAVVGDLDGVDPAGLPSRLR